MALTYYGDISVGNTIFTDGCSNSAGLYTVNNGTTNAFYSWNWNTLAMQASGALNSSSGGPTGIALTSSATAAVVYSGAVVSFVNINTGGRTDVTTNALATFTTGTVQNTQQIAGNQTTGIALATCSTSGKVTQINSNTQTLTSLSPSGIVSSGQVACIISKLDTNTFIVGTTKSQVLEIDQNGVTQKSILLPTSNNVGTTPTHTVCGLSYYNGLLLVRTNKGFIYTYNYSTSTIINIIPCPDGGTSSQSGNLCASASGYCLTGVALGSNAHAQTNEIFTNASGSIIMSTFYHESTSTAQSVGIEPTVNKAWAIFSGTINQTPNCRVFSIYCNTVSETTRAQYVLGTDIAQRIIRMKTEAIGRVAVTQDQNVASGTVSVPCADNANYTELSLYNPGTGMNFDIREFTS